jgi:hypothetical protein
LVCVYPPKLLRVSDAEPVAQHATCRIQVQIVGYGTSYSRRTSSRICAVLISPRTHRSVIACQVHDLVVRRA